MPGCAHHYSIDRRATVATGHVQARGSCDGTYRPQAPRERFLLPLDRSRGSRNPQASDPPARPRFSRAHFSASKRRYHKTQHLALPSTRRDERRPVQQHLQRWVMTANDRADDEALAVRRDVIRRSLRRIDLQRAGELEESNRRTELDRLQRSYGHCHQRAVRSEVEQFFPAAPPVRGAPPIRRHLDATAGLRKTLHVNLESS